MSELWSFKDLVPEMKKKVEFIVGVDFLQKDLECSEVPELFVEVAVEIRHKTRV